MGKIKTKKIHLVSKARAPRLVRKEESQEEEEKRKKEKEKKSKIKVWNPYFWVFDMNPKVFGWRLVAPLV